MKKMICLVGVLVLSTALLVGCTIPAEKNMAEQQNTAVQKQEDFQDQLLQNSDTDLKPREGRRGAAEQVYAETQLTEKKMVAKTPVASEITNLPVMLCKVCGDDDCDDGKYCGDAHERAENRKNNIPCKICGDDDCDDGACCDDRWDDNDDHDDDDHHGRHGRHHDD